MDSGNDALSNVLVITKSLEGERKEISRSLSGTDGFVAPMELAPGLYEMIATYPHGNIRTQVKDFVVTPETRTIETHLDYEWDQRVSLDVIDWQIQVLDRQSKPVAGAWVVVRNAEASTGTSAVKTDGRGFANVRVPVDGALITVLYDGQTFSEPAYTQTAVADCQSRCLNHAKAELRRQSHISEVRLP
jgi:hypothetical protein